MSFLTQDYRRTNIKNPEKIPSGLDAIIYSILGKIKQRRSITLDLLKIANKISSQESLWKNKTDDTLRKNLAEYKVTFHRRKKGYEKHLPSAIAAIRESANRCLGLRPFKVQLAGAVALYRGFITEMATGEGKTLTAAIAAILWGWTRLPCHIITVNDYLADRDSKWLKKLYDFCDVSIGCVTAQMKHSQRKEGHSKDITYTTCKEIVADFLRDRLALGKLQKVERRQIMALFDKREMDNELVMRGIHSAIIDEADSILIDEAVTPLIIARPQPNEQFVKACTVANNIASQLKPDIDYSLNMQYKDIELLPDLEQKLREPSRQWPFKYRGPGRRSELIRQAINAKEFFLKDKQYVLQDKKVVIVDEFTGRLMPQRTWRAGLHQLIEAKENVEITPPSETLARLSFQRFYRFFYNLSGMTGTAKEASSELWHIYGLSVVTIPQNRPCLRKQYPRQVFVDQDSKWKAIEKEIILMNNNGRPVLVGTRSVRASEKLSIRLSKLGFSVNVLNAIRHKEEAKIVSHAGEKNMITVATNMAGRGTDIRLGNGVKELGGLHIIATECHESGRVDRQLFGRSSRQGDPGSARSYVSMDDELICRYLPNYLRNTIKLLLKNNTPGSNIAANRAVNLAQRFAQNFGFKQRRSVLKMDTWLDRSLSFAYDDVN